MIKLLIATYSKIFRLLPSVQKRKSALIAVLLLIGSALDLLGLSALIPLFLLVLDPSALEAGTTLGNFYLNSGIESTTGFIAIISFGVLIVVLIKNSLGLIIQYSLAKFTFSIQEYFSNKLLYKYFHRGLSFIKASNSNRVARDVNGVPSKFSTNLLLPLLNLSNELLIITMIVVALLVYNPYVVLMVLLIVLPSFLIFYRFSKNKVQFYAEKVYELSPKIAKTLYESFFGYMDIKMSGTIDRFRKEYKENLNESLAYQVLNQTFKAAPTKVVETSMILGILVLITAGLYYYEDRSQLLTLLSVFALAAYRILPSANRLMVAVIEIRAHQYTLDVLDRVNQEYPEEHQETKEINFKQAIRFKDISFKYDNEKDYVLQGVNLEIKKGERLGIVGKSGSGKSTLMNLALLFFEPTEGAIYCDDFQLGLSTQNAWRKVIGYVPQEVFLNDGNIRENVAFGVENDEIDDNKVIECLRKASMSDLLESLEQGIYSEIGERGSKLSGGQRQRLGIARALYFGAEILFFDEATSALDSSTEKEITESINQLAKEHITMLIIAHRISSLKHCDRIIELENGKVKAEHQFSELIKSEYE